MQSPKNDMSYKNTLHMKFSTTKVGDKQILKSLHTDIIDFNEYNKEQMRLNKPIIEQVIENIRILVNTYFVDMEVSVFGSYSTNLCLTWSDVDLVLVSKSGILDPNILRKLSSLIQMQPWKKSCLLIETTNIPVVKIVTTENFLNYHIDISVQDNKHFGLKSVDLVKTFIKEYEALEPLTIALKNILKCAGLNDPFKGGLSSYGLILLIVSFLQSQQEQSKSIGKEGVNLGKLFMDFLYYYGMYFDPTKYIVCTHIPNEVSKDNNIQVSIFTYHNSNPIYYIYLLICAFIVSHFNQS
jgi:non-canonical poly(A) RNA polymerase PAPD5/7